jgi:hypothetical protein
MRFLGYTGIKPDTFGRLTINDPHLIPKLRAGRELESETELRILTFMQNYEDFK